MATIQKRGDRWRVFVGSRKNRRSRTFATRRQATSWAQEIEARGEGRGTYLMLDAIDQYQTRVSIRKRSHPWNVRRFDHWRNELPFIGKRIDMVEPDDIALWRDSRLKTVQPLTVIRELTLLSAVFQTAHKEWRWITHNPCRDVTRPDRPAPRDQVWSQDDIDAFIAQTGFAGAVENKVHEVAVAFLLALETAMRAGEILSLTPDQVRGRVAYLEKTKNGDRREVPLSTEALRLYNLLPNGFTLNSKQLDALFRKYRDKAKIEGLRFHDTRRTATVKLAAVFDVMTLAKITGHRDVKTLLNVYYKVDSESLADKLG